MDSLGPGGYRSAGAFTYSDRNLSSRQTAAVPFGTRYYSRLPYGVNITLTTTGSSSAGVIHRFRLNSLYDPDSTGTGHQPYQYDTLSAIYLRYLVTKAHVNITFTDPTADGVWVGLVVRNASDISDNPTGLALEDYLERPLFKMFPLNNTGAQTATFNFSVPMWEIWGMTELQYRANFLDYGAAFNANPSGEVLMELILVDPTANVTTRSVRASGRIVFEAEHLEPNFPSAS